MTTTIANSTAGSTATTETGSRSPRRGANIALWALQVVTAAVFVMAALPKVTADPQAVAGFAAMGFGTVGMYIIGTLEIAGAIALLTPRLAGPAGLAFIGLMVGAVITTLLMFGPSLVAMPAAVLVAVAIIAYGRRGQTAQLVALTRSRAGR
jgi:uncharacterized membrane protein YphA (DoxX/SURF4 family)